MHLDAFSEQFGRFIPGKTEARIAAEHDLAVLVFIAVRAPAIHKLAPFRALALDNLAEQIFVEVEDVRQIFRLSVFVVVSPVLPARSRAKPPPDFRVGVSQISHPADRASGLASVAHIGAMVNGDGCDKIEDLRCSHTITPIETASLSRFR